MTSSVMLLTNSTTGCGSKYSNRNHNFSEMCEYFFHQYLSGFYPQVQCFMLYLLNIVMPRWEI